MSFTNDSYGIQSVRKTLLLHYRKDLYSFKMINSVSSLQPVTRYFSHIRLLIFPEKYPPVPFTVTNRDLIFGCVSQSGQLDLVSGLN